MTKETLGDIVHEDAAPSAKRPWVEPKLVTVKGRDAAASFRPGGNVDYGLYS